MDKTLPLSFLLLSKEKKILPHSISHYRKNRVSCKWKRNAIWFLVLIPTIFGTPLSSLSSTVKAKIPQTISFTAAEVVYGSPDFVPQASSSSGLPLSFTSSDLSVASIENGKIHIKKAGSVTITATQQGNDDYEAASPVGQLLIINPKPLNILLLAESFITKIYDGNATIYVDSVPFNIQEQVSDDEVWFSGTGTFDSEDAGYDRVITFDQLTLHGAAKDNYTVESVLVMLTAFITPKPLTLSLSTTSVISKVYDGNTNAPVPLEDYSLHGMLSGDEVTVAARTAVYADKKIGVGKSIITSGITLGGADKNNYSVQTISAETTGSITPKPLSISLLSESNVSKVYDGQTAVRVDSIEYDMPDKSPGDKVWIAGNGNFNDKNAGYDKSITFDEIELVGPDKSNYTIADANVILTGRIVPKLLILSLQPSVISKVYDGNTGAPVPVEDYTLQSALGADEVSVSACTAAYEDKNTGTGKRIVTTGVTLAGADKDNYRVEASSVETTGSITPKPLTISLLSESNVSKVYDGQTSVRVDSIYYDILDIVAGEKVWIAGDGNFDDKNAGYDKTITFDAIDLVGPDKNNYTIADANVILIGSIEPKSLAASLQARPLVSKIYDGTTQASLNSGNYSLLGIIAGDDVVVNNPLSGTYDTKHVGSNKNVKVTGLTISGSHAGNYKLDQQTIQAPIGNILARDVIVTALSQIKQYGSSDPAFTYTVTGMLTGDELTGNLERTAGTKVGGYPISVGTLSAEDYHIVEFFPSNLEITPASLIITAEDKIRNQGEVNPNFTFRYDGFVNGETPSNLPSPAIATTTAVSGSPAGQYDIAVSGATSDNYDISFVKGILTILPVENEARQVSVWNEGRNAVHINIRSDVPQRAALILYSYTGQPIVVQQKNLGAGNNSFTLPVNNLSAGSYTLRVKAEKFNNAQNVNIR